MRYSEIQSMLTETYTYMDKQYSVHPIKEGASLYGNHNSFNAYLDALSQGLSPRDEKIFRECAKNLRGFISEANTTQAAFTPYNYLLLPLLRVFFPRLIAREAITVDTMDKPFAIRYFMKAVLKSFTGTVIGNVPDLSSNASKGPIIPASTTIPLVNGRGVSNILSVNGFPTNAGLQRDILFVKITDGTDDIDINTAPDNITGTSTINVTYPTSGVSETLIVNVNYATGDASAVVQSTTAATPTTTGLYVTGTVSLEDNTRSNEMTLSYEPIQFSAISRKLKIKWSLEFEQDIQALFDMDAQAQMLDFLGAQIAVDIDAEIINDLLITANTLNPTNQTTFSKTPPVNFMLGPKAWYENLIVSINNVSASIYTDTMIAPGNILLVNPIDLSLLQSTNEYSKTDDITGGELVATTPYNVGTLASTWKVLSSPLVPQNKIIVMLKPEDPKAAIYSYLLYRPVTVAPWPMENIPAITFMSRYAKRVLRPKGIGIITLTP